ncbi:hypothetical protein SynBIOSU31_02592 [Synechococcus sp. BIOS-U3-1]|uniref:YceD family protein n=1 Tax=Synechococcus sp. BIOS-U3-1 TaxID=1400865 RepID=UPI00164732FE|nr:DUF177 domain-containing protein [Synechococcus sp. BIOS-U3-1]QNI59455.1 hypothetical protein SynBIOSU31_02592 [Synechococcus sp. BIOS-U3-1]
MIPGLEPVPLRELQALGTFRVWSVAGQLDEMPSLTPVRGTLRAEHRGNLLEVEGSVQTIVCLRCDRCLGHFNQQLSAISKELIWLGQEPSDDHLAEAGLDLASPDGLMECLDPRGDFEPERWVFEQLSLQMSVVNRCGKHCPGMPQKPSDASPTREETTPDPRWQALKDLQSSMQRSGTNHD